MTAEKHTFPLSLKMFTSVNVYRVWGESDGEGWGIRVVVRREVKTMMGGGGGWGG